MKTLEVPDLTALQPLVVACCDEEGAQLRYRLHLPWLDGLMVYATDRRIIARVPAASLPDGGASFAAPPRARVPRNVAELFDGDQWPPLAGLPVPDPGPVVFETCGNCMGTGRVGCDERGEIVPTPADDPVAFPCGICDGAGKWEVFTPLNVGRLGSWNRHWRINSRYARLLRSHGVTTLHLPCRVDGPARFQADRIEGLLMGMSP